MGEGPYRETVYRLPKPKRLKRRDLGWLWLSLAMCLPVWTLYLWVWTR